METIELATFEEYVQWIQANASGPKFLFRGQPNSAWNLDTTLERYFPTDMPMQDYYGIAYRAKEQMSAFSGKKWDMLNPNEYVEWLKQCRGDSIYFDRYFDPVNKFYKNLGYECLIYLRHFGFPSPLLDWTKSPYVAAFFAFNRVEAGRVSIFVYTERPNGTKSGGSGIPIISQLSSISDGHRRHYQQQSCYTICCMLQPVILNTLSHYVSHDKVFSKGASDQDVLWKLILPATEQVKVLNYLNEYNLNAYSLYGSDESLMETLAFNEFFGREGYIPRSR